MNPIAPILRMVKAALWRRPVADPSVQQAKVAAALDALNAKANRRRSEWEAEAKSLQREYVAAGGSLPAESVSDWLMGPRPTASFSAQRGGGIAARYDTALTTTDNRAHWAMADALAADAQANPMVRYVLRNRARYEVQNNGYARGIGKTIVNDTIGRGPRLHIDDERLDPEVRSDVERKFHAWAKAVKLATKMRVMRQAASVF